MKHTYQGSKIIISGQDAIYTLSGSPVIVLGVYRHFEPVCPLHGAVRACINEKENDKWMNLKRC